MSVFDTRQTDVTNTGDWVTVYDFESPGCSCMACIVVQNLAGDTPTSFRWRLRPEPTGADYIAHPAVSDAISHKFLLAAGTEISGIYPIPKGATYLQAKNSGAGAATIKVWRASLPKETLAPTIIDGEAVVDDPSTSTASCYAQVLNGAGAPEVIAANPRRKSLLIDNPNTVEFTVCFADPTAPGVYGVVLAAATGAANGTGGKFQTTYTGDVYLWDHTSSGPIGAIVIEEF